MKKYEWSNFHLIKSQTFATISWKIILKFLKTVVANRSIFRKLVMEQQCLILTQWIRSRIYDSDLRKILYSKCESVYLRFELVFRCNPYSDSPKRDDWNEGWNLTLLEVYMGQIDVFFLPLCLFSVILHLSLIVPCIPVSLFASFLFFQ